METESDESDLEAMSVGSKSHLEAKSVGGKSDLEAKSVKSKSCGSVLVNPRKRGNLLLKSIRNVRWEYKSVEGESAVEKKSVGGKSVLKAKSFKSKSSGSVLVNPRNRGNLLLKSIRKVRWEYKSVEGENAVEEKSVGSKSDLEAKSVGDKGKAFLLVNPHQKLNPVLKTIRNVHWEYEKMEPDFVMGKTACALFLNLRFHYLFPNYIHDRLKSLGKAYELRVLLVQVDVPELTETLKDLSVIAVLAECTLVIAWSAEEAGSYLETFKMFENKSADSIKERPCDDQYSQLIDRLTTVRSVNKTDATVLLSTFGTLEKVMLASTAELALCPGIGPLKAQRLYEALRKPLKNERSSANN